MSSVPGDKKPAGTWDFDGSCMPGKAYYPGDTFSVGVFQWVSTADGKDVKRAKVVKRYKGWTGDPEPTLEKAHLDVAQRNKAQSGD